MAVWVQVKSIFYGDEKGKLITYFPGDWVQVSRTKAIYLQNEGIAKIPDNTIYKHLSLKDCGVAMIGPSAESKSVSIYPASLPTRALDIPGIPFPRTILWNPDTPANVPLFMAGLNLLEKWDILAPIKDYELLAQDYVTEDDREWASEMLPDLRLPLFNMDLLFIKKNDVTSHLVTLWNEFVATGHASDISFLCAVYHTRPLLLSLPIIWTDMHA